MSSGQEVLRQGQLELGLTASLAALVTGQQAGHILLAAVGRPQVRLAVGAGPHLLCGLPAACD